MKYTRKKARKEGENMKKKHENTIFPSSPYIILFFHVYKFVLTKYQNKILSKLVTSYTSQDLKASWEESM
jgi:hypothetical protein